ncbi:flavodoxin family protein [Sinimarinibacterium sp. CAU 1509]|uniref:flavodoxin family protein n=1 Tax=Sinimarinibacterium sp. CAU 1509 TaxID=2562283 RepID=UPI0010ACD6CE|nr:NAD(P)H-dependent oxidoreductase [Sinimarinibacterium sp. CAU 1509]TJY64962.1 flavodoxin family protein [Sinimarinibacterium sp. CAU 1509]
MKQLLLIFHSQTGRTRRLAEAVATGVAELADDVELRVREARAATLDDLLWAQGLLLGTPENFGYMSGALKDFMDRTYYPAEGKTIGLPYAVFISCENDGRGAVSAIERIATGYGWRQVAAALICRGDITSDHEAEAHELGQTLAAGLALGLF